MKRTLLSLLSIFAFSFTAFAQLPDGSISPDFTAKDINGVEYNLYDYLAEGKPVILDFSATWCPPCWSYSQAGHLHDLMELYGPDGTDELMVFFIEGDITTNMADLLGQTAASMGDWVTGTNHPILDQAFISAQHQIGQYPTLIGICPDRKLRRLGQDNTATMYQFATSCPDVPQGAPEVSFYADLLDGCESLNVNFAENSWPRAEEWLWDFGDGNTSTEKAPNHTYDSEGNYTVSLTVTNGGESTTLTKEENISVGTGAPYYDQIVGPEDINIGTGRYFEGGHQALIFDAMDDFILSSVKVFSAQEGERTIVLIDGSGVLINQRKVMIPEGESRVDLELFVPQGTDYRLGLYSDAYLFRNDGGVNYPYNIDNLVSIKESTAGTEPLRYYYYFYDWNVKETGCQAISDLDEERALDVEIYPNPVQDVLNIQGFNFENAAISISNTVGQKVLTKHNIYGTNVSINIAHLESGIYFVNAEGQSYKFFKE